MNLLSSDVYVRMVDLPSGIRAFTAPDMDGGYNVYISNDLCSTEAHKALQHELKHILLGHFESGKRGTACEEEVKRGA